ncbi:sugar-binding transcriptional regulator [Falsarthrobacter nasiphocae]|uniref:DNA-binding transcriptional regulator LsrR (DeoR family) n=1 Tax=Falsarthrobacter nasiphocae TaxID=189863 RepID=A0AAE3YHU9_9MICC|nr:sugar-binding domain-containing protein [Falsarthrobacter nasiphocae]MDR6892997.1 DNA-binding transcriptional regulator LsrR (DeoR family) [Falsarthrobacter nasiphocae]
MGKPTPDQAVIAARMHYLEGRTMESIAHEFKTSRSTVSRWIARARDLGHVEIHVHPSLDTPAQLERRIAERYGIGAVVVPCSPRARSSEVLESTAAFAARLIASEVVPGSVIGVAWGSTISAVARHLPPKKTNETTIVQLNGAGNTFTSGIHYTSEILRRFGQAFGASIEQFPVPALFDSPLTRELMWKERSVARITALQARMSMAVFGIGALDPESPSHVYVGGYLEPADLRELERLGVAGDIATRFFLADGSDEGIPVNARSSAPEFDVLLRAPKRICVLSSAAKVPGLRAALAGGYITDVVLDDKAARRLLAEDGPAARP